MLEAAWKNPINVVILKILKTREERFGALCVSTEDFIIDDTSSCIIDACAFER